MWKRIVRLTCVLAGAILWTLLAGHQSGFSQSCDSDISNRKERAYDVLLDLSSQERSYVERVHFLHGRPGTPTSATNEHLLHQDEYIINYDNDLGVPIWVAYRLTREHLAYERERTECFRRDVRLEDEDAAFCEDYEEPIYDRGHMVPNADMVRSEPAMINTYMLSNMCPQHDRFNRGIWARLESRVRQWARVRGHVYVITGAVFDRNEDGERDADNDAELMDPNEPGREPRVAIPSHFYKIILHERVSGYIDTITILLPHVDDSPSGQQVDPYLTDHLENINRIEALTGVDFLPDLPDAKEEAIENFKATILWPVD